MSDTPRADNPSAQYEALFARHRDEIVRFCRGALPGREDFAEDVTQEVFIALLHAIESGTIRDSPRGWLFGTARNKCSDLLRREVAELPDSELAESSEPGDAGTDETVARNLTTQAVWDKIEAWLAPFDDDVRHLHSLYIGFLERQNHPDDRPHQETHAARWFREELGVPTRKAEGLRSDHRHLLLALAWTDLLIQSGDGCPRLRKRLDPARRTGHTLAPKDAIWVRNHLFPDRRQESNCSTCRAQSDSAFEEVKTRRSIWSPALLPVLFEAQSHLPHAHLTGGTSTLAQPDPARPAGGTSATAQPPGLARRAASRSRRVARLRRTATSAISPGNVLGAILVVALGVILAAPVPRPASAQSTAGPTAGKARPARALILAATTDSPPPVSPTPVASPRPATSASTLPAPSRQATSAAPRSGTCTGPSPAPGCNIPTMHSSQSQAPQPVLPTASVTVTQTAGDTVTADATASTPGSLPIAAYSYDWGDGTTTQDPSAQGTQTHQYTADGSYTIRVTAFDTAGRASASASATLSVGPPTGPITLAGTSSCLTDSGTTIYVTSGKTVYISAVCDGDPSQQWTLAPNGELQNQGQCLVELDDVDAAQYDLLEPCTGAAWASSGIYTQLFYPQGDGTIIDRPDPGSQLTYCLVADATSGAVTFTGCTSGAPGQSWTLPGYASASSGRPTGP